MIDALCLKVEDYQDSDHWRWQLTDTAENFLADHEVALDRGASAYSGYIDLEQYLEHNAAPDRWPEDEVRLVDEVGAWIGEHVLGRVGSAILKYGTPVTVRVVVPPAAEDLLYRPLELAHVGDRPLSVQDVALAFEVEEEITPVRRQAIGDRVRMLAVFSLPDRSRALALRQERYELQRLIREVVQTEGRAIELRILQYGVSKDQLREVLAEGEGWDVLHFSGHGTPARLLLEQPDGGADEIGSDELVQLMRRARRRLKLVVLSSCQSAAAIAQETRLWLGLGDGAAIAAGAGETKGATGHVVPGVARALVRELDCAVLAMRYPVAQEFAGALTGRLYRDLLNLGNPLDEALQVALPDALAGYPNPGVPPLSVATPALFGRNAPGLALQAPRAPPAEFKVPETGLRGFPREPERFVGRVATLARAGTALASGSGKAGVLFHGTVAGAGKTCCAVEVAYRYEQGRFGGFVWYEAPGEDADITGALLGLARAMEKQLPKFEMVHIVDRPDNEFADWLPRLRELLERRSLLIVLDKLESLLTHAGGWRVQKWGRLVATLLDHRGLSRVVLTSRRVPTALADETRVLREEITVLSLDEATVLARQLPNLGRLLRGESPAGLDRGRKLVARTLGVVQGCPKLLEDFDRQAADPDALERHLERAEAAWQLGEEGRVGAFPCDGESLVVATPPAIRDTSDSGNGEFLQPDDPVKQKKAKLISFGVDKYCQPLDRASFDTALDKLLEAYRTKSNIDLKLEIPEYKDFLADFETLSFNECKNEEEERRLFAIKNHMRFLRILYERRGVFSHELAPELNLLIDARDGIRVIIDEFWVKQRLLYNQTEVSDAILAFLKLIGGKLGAPTRGSLVIIGEKRMFMPEGLPANGRYFDICPLNDKYLHVSIYIEDFEVDRVSRNLGVDRHDLTIDKGLTLGDLAHQFIVDPAIPRIVDHYIFLKSEGVNIDENVFFDIREWRIGLS